jgi:hypothetical protein
MASVITLAGNSSGEIVRIFADMERGEFGKTPPYQVGFSLKNTSKSNSPGEDP